MEGVPELAKNLAARFVATLVDEEGISGTCTAYYLLDPSLPLTDADDVLGGWLVALDQVTSARILDAHLELLPTLPGELKNEPDSTSDLSRTGLFNFSHAVGTHRYGFAVPSISRDGDVVSGGRPVLTPGSPCANLVDFMLLSTDSVDNTTDQSQKLEALLDVFISFRKYTLQLARRSAKLA